jgi:hypothetical protein
MGKNMLLSVDASDLGAECARWHQDPGAGLRALRTAVVDIRSDRAVLLAAAGHRDNHDAVWYSSS